jgi:hypothetical protein
MQAAEHGASFPMARKLRRTMTHAQLHDFAVGSEKNKPSHVLHPKMQQRSQMVKAAHTHLALHLPGFRAMPAARRMKAVQAHVTRQLKGR